MKIKPFKALRPLPENAKAVSSPPYDVLDSAEAREMAYGNPMSFLHVIKPEIDLAEGVDLYSDAVYAQAVKNFKLFQERGYLVRENAECLYLYSQTMGKHTQYGLVCCCRADEYGSIIKKHEYTLKSKENDRTRHVSELNANAGPVFLTYRDDQELNALLSGIKETTPLFDIDAPDGTRHNVWRISECAELVAAFERVPFAYVADGHHRSASAVRVARERMDANPNHTGDEEYNWFLCVLFPASELKLMSYNRCVKDLNGMDKEAFLNRLKENFTVTEGGSPEPSAEGEAGMYLDGEWFRISWSKPESDDPVARLGATVLQDGLLHPILGIEDPRTSDRMKFIGGIRGTSALEYAVDSGEYAVAFSMFPVDILDLIAVADADKVMPPKSTWFEPKLRSGLLVHSLD